MKVEVKAEHIAKGVRWGYYDCPLALGIREATQQTPIMVGLADVQVRGVAYPLPPLAIEWRARFDYNQGDCPPFSFDLPIDPPPQPQPEPEPEASPQPWPKKGQATLFE